MRYSIITYKIIIFIFQLQVTYSIRFLQCIIHCSYSNTCGIVEVAGAEWEDSARPSNSLERITVSPEMYI